MTLQKKIEWLRLSILTALLMCAAMLWLVNQQAQIIAGQQAIIRLLFEDSQELNRLRMQEVQRQNMRKRLQKEVPKDAALGCFPGQVCG